MAKEKDTTVRGAVEQARKSTIEEIMKSYKLGRKVTTPLKSLTHEKEMAFEVEGEMVTQAAAGGPDSKKGPMTVLPVIDLSTGESVTLVLNTVLQSALQRVPDGYVGKKFIARLLGKKPGKDYFDVDLFELEDG